MNTAKVLITAEIEIPAAQFKEPALTKRDIMMALARTVRESKEIESITILSFEFQTANPLASARD